MIDLFITSSSRPQLLPYCVGSLKKFVHTRQKLYCILHEDFVYPKESEKVIEWAEKSNFFDTIESSNPAQGFGLTLQHYLNEVIDTKYCFYIQDDWEFERPIDLDHILYVMEQNPHINFIMFPRRFNDKKSFEDTQQTEYTYNNLKLCMYNQVCFLPAVWRMSKIKEAWQNFNPLVDIRPEHFFIYCYSNDEQKRAPNIV